MKETEKGFLDNEVEVIYIVNDSITVTAKMSQEKLSRLLESPDIFLVAVNKEKKVYRKKKKVKGISRAKGVIY